VVRSDDHGRFSAGTLASRPLLSGAIQVEVVGEPARGFLTSPALLVGRRDDHR
jgi:hypothetical protein